MEKKKRQREWYAISGGVRHGGTIGRCHATATPRRDDYNDYRRVCSREGGVAFPLTSHHEALTRLFMSPRKTCSVLEHTSRRCSPVLPLPSTKLE